MKFTTLKTFSGLNCLHPLARFSYGLVKNQ